jgi:IclR family acetate operon transcriptional repressor
MSLISSRASSKPVGPPERPEGSLVQSLCRALLLLEKLSEANNGCRLRDLCRITGLSPSTAHRLLTTMEQRRFVAFDKDSSVWQVGSKCLTVGAVFMRRRTFLSDAARHMEILSQSLGETVNLGVLDDESNILVLKQTRARQLSSGLTPVGSHVSRHASAMGKVLLAAKSRMEREWVLELPYFARFTPKTIVEPSNLLAELEIVSARGYAIDDEESASGKRCVAAPVYNELGECVAAVSVSSDKRRLPDGALPRIAGRLATAASEMTALSGGFSPTRRSADAR